MNAEATEFIPSGYTNLSLPMPMQCEARCGEHEHCGYLEASGSDWEVQPARPFSSLNPEAEEFLPGVGAVSSSTLPFEPALVSANQGLADSSDSAKLVQDALQQVRRLEEGSALTIQRFWRNVKLRAASRCIPSAKTENVSADQSISTSLSWAKWTPTGKRTKSQKKRMGSSRSATSHKLSNQWHEYDHDTSDRWLQDARKDHSFGYDWQNLQAHSRKSGWREKSARARSRGKSKSELRWRPKKVTPESIVDLEVVAISSDAQICAGEEVHTHSSNKEGDAGCSLRQVETDIGQMSGRRKSSGDIEISKDDAKEIRAGRCHSKHDTCSLKSLENLILDLPTQQRSSASILHAASDSNAMVKTKSNNIKGDRRPKSARDRMNYESSFQWDNSQSESSPWQNWEPSRLHSNPIGLRSESQNRNAKHESNLPTSLNISHPGRTGRSSYSRSKSRSKNDQSVPRQNVSEIADMNTAIRSHPAGGHPREHATTDNTKREKSIQRSNVASHLVDESLDWKPANGALVRRWGQETHSSAASRIGLAGVSYYPCSNRDSLHADTVQKPSKGTSDFSTTPLDVRWIQWQ